MQILPLFLLVFVQILGTSSGYRQTQKDVSTGFPLGLDLKALCAEAQSTIHRIFKKSTTTQKIQADPQNDALSLCIGQ